MCVSATVQNSQIVAIFRQLQSMGRDEVSLGSAVDVID